jgi:hypothetical protein
MRAGFFYFTVSKDSHRLNFHNAYQGNFARKHHNINYQGKMT